MSKKKRIKNKNLIGLQSITDRINQNSGNTNTGQGSRQNDPTTGDYINDLDYYVRHNWMANKCVSHPVSRCVSPWRTNDINNELQLKTFSVKDKCVEIAIKARTHGGCILFPELSEKVDLEQDFNKVVLIRNPVTNIKVISHSDLTKVGDDLFYLKSNNENQKVHKSWLYKIESQYSLKQSLPTILAATALERASRVSGEQTFIDIFKIKDLAEQIDDCGDEDQASKLLSRLALMKRTASIYNAYVLDADTEDYERHSITSDSVAKVYKIILASVAHSAGINIAVFAPAECGGSLGSNNVVGLEQYYDMLHELRAGVITDAVNYIDRLMNLSYNIPEIKEWEWPNIRPLSLDEMIKVMDLYDRIIASDIPNSEYVATKMASHKGLFIISDNDLESLKD